MTDVASPGTQTLRAVPLRPMQKLSLDAHRSNRHVGWAVVGRKGPCNSQPLHLFLYSGNSQPFERTDASVGFVARGEDKSRP